MRTAEDPKPLSGEIGTKMAQYRQQLLAAGMREPAGKRTENGQWLFYRPQMPQTAFVVNLRGTDDHIEVTCGYASTAFTRMAGDENALIQWGVSNEEITIREKVIIRDEADEKTARVQIQQMYLMYLTMEKEALLDCARAKRKEFLQRITAKLKPLGFRKKGNTWTRALEADCCLTFEAQKSAYSDEYYFNVCIGKNGSHYFVGACCYERVAPGGRSPMDWQALSRDEFDFFLEHTVVPTLGQIIHTPLQELGKLPSIWSVCSCDRKKCDACWVEKNLWEAKACVTAE